jgi:drug/metabolite transporter (DMT)-like permease
MAVAGWRLSLAAALLFLWPPARSGLGGVGRRQLAMGALAAFFLAVHFGTWIASLRMLPVAVSVVLVSTHPVFVVALRAVNGQRPCLAEGGGVALALAGLVVMSGPFVQLTPDARLGAALALSGGAALAVYLVIGSGVRRHVATPSFLLLVYGVAGLGLLGSQLVAGGSILPPRPVDGLLYLALAIFPTIGGHGLFAHAVGHVRPVVVSMCFLSEPVVSTLLAIPFFGEVPSPSVWLGACLVLAGLGAVTMSGARPTETPGDTL